MSETKKYVYSFAEGKGVGKDILGGKGANLRSQPKLVISITKITRATQQKWISR